jgi:uncharacterized protein YbbK (DUF523 family)
MFGTPRDVANIVGGDGFDVLDGRARVLTDSGEDWTKQMIAGAHAMLERARAEQVDLALLRDISAACASQVIYDGPWAGQRYRRGPGVCAALVIRSGIPVVSQRDYRTLRALFAHLGAVPPEEGTGLDHHESDWYQDYFSV